MRWLCKGFLFAGALVLAQVLEPGLSAASRADEQRQVNDYWGRPVSLAAPARRIIALSPHATENVFSAGAGEYLLAAVDYSDYPEAARTLPRVGSFHAVSLERIAALEPDLIIVWGSNQGEQTVAQLDKLGLTYYVDEPRRVEDVARSVRDIGTLAGTEAVADATARHYLEAFAELRERYGDAGEVSVLYQIWHDPLQTLNGEHLVSDVIRLCGGRNVYADAATLAPVISMESVLSRNPDAIVASSNDGAAPPWLSAWQRWPALTAVRHDNLFVVHSDHIQRHTLRILDGARAFCEHLETARRRLHILQ